MLSGVNSKFECTLSILENATQVAPDAEKSGFFRYVFENWEMVYNPDTKEIWHILPID